MGPPPTAAAARPTAPAPPREACSQVSATPGGGLAPRASAVARARYRCRPSATRPPGAAAGSGDRPRAPPGPPTRQADRCERRSRRIGGHPPVAAGRGCRACARGDPGPEPCSSSPGRRWPPGRALAQLLLAQQLGQQPRSRARGLRASFREGRIALVHVGTDPVEEQPRRERRGRSCLDADHADMAGADAVQHPRQGAGGSNTSRRTFSVGLEEDGERAVTAGHRQEVGGSLALHPERRGAARAVVAGGGAPALRSPGSAKRTGPCRRAHR